MDKIKTGEYETGEDPFSKEKQDFGSTLDPKVLAAYKKVGVVLRAYKSGKLPKAFKIIPQTSNWEELLLLTNPAQWSPHSHF